MDMSRFLMGRIAAVSAAIFFAALLFALWRAQFDVELEERGAADVARAFEHLSALQDEPPEGLDAHVAALREIVGSDRMRHLQLRLADATGRELIGPPPPAAPSWLERAFVALLPPESAQANAATWVIRRDEGVRFVATFMLNPASEQEEALDDTLGLLGTLLGYGVLTLMAVFWALRRALAPLQPIHTAIGHYRDADYAWRVPPLPMRELDAVGQALNHMAGALAQAQEARRTLSLKLLGVQEEERTYIARELHDELGQVLTAMRADIAWLQRRADGTPDVQDVVGGLAASCGRLHEGVSDLLDRLRPQGGRDGDGPVPLHGLLESLLQGWRDRPGQDAVLSLAYDARVEPLGDELALTIYRMTQEALTNAMRYSGARRIEVTLGLDREGRLRWQVEDDGVGIDALDRAIHRGNGLAGISERVWAHHGEIEIQPRTADPQRPGARLSARFPRSGRRTD
ncbi:ATP-binding protein [Dokdonella koreensis]|uniref:histidine kinase n=1 Tax=Dokdonella koreensis DS-123 TaxID=1300342 RepID=A0A160DW98_9GAMM|nr:histidine kinase [Dokdonella koreensis]ANB18143.1 Signal transduction histidine kinase, glucose-6-phosphate specific [Dokdonella koreensis DS-123]